jgi:hypothetical protein
MEKLGLLRLGAFVDPFATGRVAALAHVGVEVVGNVNGIVKEFLNLPVTTFCASTTGIHGLIGVVAVPTEADLVKVATDSIWNLEGVRTVRTWPVVRVLAHRSDLVRIV